MVSIRRFDDDDDASSSSRSVAHASHLIRTFGKTAHHLNFDDEMDA